MEETAPTSTSTTICIEPTFIDKLKCVRCKNVLSVAPVYSLVNGENICGRCFDKNNIEGQKNLLYETVLQFLTFPCMNRQYGCLESRLGKDMYNHEIRCSYRRINCTSCDWIGDLDNLLEHFEEKHPRNLLIQPSFEINFIHNFEEIYLFPFGDSLFLLRQHGEALSKSYHCSLMTIYKNESENFEYFLTIKNSSNDKKIEYPHKRATSLSDEDGITLKFEEVEKELQNPLTITATIDVIECSDKSKENGKKGTNSLSEKNMEMLKIIECPVCLEYMVPPIYQCQTGHSICGDCKPNITTCPTCQEPFEGTQNYAVESFTALLKYPCKNIESGCDFSSEAKTIKQHEKTCLFSSYSCPTKYYTDCSWTGMHQFIWKHCQNAHTELVLENQPISLPFDQNDFTRDDNDCFIFKSHNKIFLLNWKYESVGKIFYWATQFIGPLEESENYYFDLDIIDRSGKNSRIYMRSLCQSMGNRDEVFNDGKSILFLLYDQVEAMINDVFCFKISIQKVTN